MMEHYLTVSSNTEKFYVANKCNNFKVKLNQDLDLSNGIWKVALTKISYPFNWNNLDEEENATVTIFHNVKDKSIMNGRAFNKDELDFSAILNSHNLNVDNRYVKTQFPVRSGYYENAEEICKFIMHEFYYTNTLTEFQNLVIDSISIQNGLRVFFSGHDAILFSNATKLVKALKLDSALGKPNAKYFIGNFVANTDLEILTNIFVCCNIVEHNLVSDTSAQLLTSVPIEGKHGNTRTYSPLFPEYKNVSENIISDIEIHLKNGNGELIKFKAGRVDITLHFKRVDI